MIRGGGLDEWNDSDIAPGEEAILGRRLGAGPDELFDVVEWCGRGERDLAHGFGKVEETSESGWSVVHKIAVALHASGIVHI